MREYPQEMIDSLRGMIVAQNKKIASLIDEADRMYKIAVFYKEQWQAAESKIKGE